MVEMSDFAARVRSVVRRIPHGRVATYGDVAAAAGGPAHTAQSATSCAHCGDSSIPCHRVIAAGGKLGGYGRDLFAKRAPPLAEGHRGLGGTDQRLRRTLRWMISGPASR